MPPSTLPNRFKDFQESQNESSGLAGSKPRSKPDREHLAQN